MRRTARNFVGVAATIALIALAISAFAASSASAIGIANFEAGTCTTDATPAAECTFSNPASSMYTQAAGHPNYGITDFTVGEVSGENQAKRGKVELPKGLNVNPQAVPQCPVATFESDEAACAASAVGTSYVTSEPEVLLLKPKIGPLPFTVYDLVPKEGEPGLFGFHVTLEVPIVGTLISEYIFLETQIEWAGDYHESFTINNIPAFPPLGRNRLVFNGRAGNGSFLTLPSPCNGNSTSLLELESQSGAKAGPQPTTPPVPIAGCA